MTAGGPRSTEYPSQGHDVAPVEFAKQEFVRRYIPDDDRSLADELIRERREEAARELREGAILEDLMIERSE